MDDADDTRPPGPVPGTGPGIEDAPAHLAPRPASVAAPMRSPLALAGTGLAGVAMGAAEIVPGFSGGTVALVTGIYERLVTNIRQGARVLSLALRGRFADAGKALLSLEWLFVGILLVGMGTAVGTLAGTLGDLIDGRPVDASAVFLGLVLGAAVVASGQLRRPGPLHLLVGVVVAAAAFVGLGLFSGTVPDPTLPVLFVGVAVAVCAWILPGVSGSFLLLIMGLYPAALAAVDDRDLAVLGVMVLGALAGLTAFSTLLNWLLARFHDLVLAVMLGLLVGSARVLWPWPSETGMGDPALGTPPPGQAYLPIALALGAFALVWVVGLLAQPERDASG